MQSLDLNDIRTFAATAEAGTLSAAARDLRVPPSTISRSLTRLEKHLGVSLLQRSSRGFHLTDAGKEYLQVCKRALRTLKDGHDVLDTNRTQPTGLIKVACPITMAREVLAPLLPEFLSRFPQLRVEIESYASGFDQEPREDVDVFFKLRAPRDSSRRIRSYPGTARGLFASPAYSRVHGLPSNPDELTNHECIGMNTWTLQQGKKIVTTNIKPRVLTSDPYIHLTLTTQGFGIGMLPLWLADWPDVRDKLVPVLPEWKVEPLVLCALFYGQAQRTPKVQTLLDFLAEYMGTDRDPRLKQKWAKKYFTPLSPQKQAQH
jgi:LysR family transcriptional activator of dmlA